MLGGHQQIVFTVVVLHQAARYTETNLTEEWLIHFKLLSRIFENMSAPMYSKLQQ